MIASFGYGERAFAFLRYVPGRDLTGHFLIFGTLSVVINLALQRASAEATLARQIRGSCILAVVVSLEEFSQAILPTRTFSLLDLGGSLAGILVGAIGAIWWSRRRFGDAA
jgi:hypothetical protein